MSSIEKMEKDGVILVTEVTDLQLVSIRSDSYKEFPYKMVELHNPRSLKNITISAPDDLEGSKDVQKSQVVKVTIGIRNTKQGNKMKIYKITKV